MREAEASLDALVLALQEQQEALEGHERWLRLIASYESHNEESGCRCGHKMAFCHKVNAAMWCGGPGHEAIARHALGECPPVCIVCIDEARSSPVVGQAGETR
jgi:hypothetical protein